MSFEDTDTHETARQLHKQDKNGNSMTPLNRSTPSISYGNSVNQKKTDDWRKRANSKPLTVVRKKA